MTVPLDVDVGRIVAGKYALERLVGQGGMGEVWKARHVSLGEPIAVKLLRVPEGEEESVARARFDLEAKIAARLRRSTFARLLHTSSRSTSHRRRSSPSA
jgi:serine/threonine-protein kinase